MTFIGKAYRRLQSWFYRREAAARRPAEQALVRATARTRFAILAHDAVVKAEIRRLRCGGWMFLAWWRSSPSDDWKLGGWGFDLVQMMEETMEGFWNDQV